MLKNLLIIILANYASAHLFSKPILPPAPGPLLNIVVTMKNTTDNILNTLSATNFATRADRLNAVTAALQNHAATTQGPLLNFLSQTTGPLLSVQSLWITNQILIKGVVVALVDVIAARADVLGISSEKYVNLITPYFNLNPQQGDSAWGIVKIQAPAACAIANGTGVRVASIDTGVRYTHEALRNNFVGPYGWYDPYYYSSTPSDTSGHGTHTMGTLAGSGVGVAPGSEWMTCKGCDGEVCSLTSLLLCNQFMLCPTLTDGSAQDCSQAPHLISNSFGSGQGDTSFDSSIKAFHAAGIIPIYAAGNGGPNCNTVVSPADSQLDVIAVGSTTSVDAVDATSSLGPSIFGTIKPDITAPGFLILSSYNASDSQYAVGVGTSFACPHVAGTVAILLSANSSLTYQDVKKHLFAGVATSTLLANPAVTCGGVSQSTFPNNEFGYGRLNALNSLNSVLTANIAK